MNLKISSYLLAWIAFPLFAFSQQAIQNEGNMQLHTGAQLALYGDFTNNGTFVNSAGSLCTVGGSTQTINGSNPLTVSNFVVENDADVALDNVLQIAGTLTFTSGKLVTNKANITTEYVHFLAGSSHSGADNDTYIDGAVRKTGNTAFTFPVGDNGNLQPISISAPALATDHFTAYYEESMAPYSLTTKEASIHHLSTCQYWILNRTGGTSAVEVSLGFDANSCGIDELCDLLVCRWDDSQWVNEGNGGTTGSIAAGTVTSGDGTGNCGSALAISSFSPFTLGSSSEFNPMPVELLNFDARRSGIRQVDLSWETATEVNNDFFVVERSADRNNWEHLLQVPGVGNSSVVQTYQAVDTLPGSGINYYRLQQVDQDGQYSYSRIRSVTFEELEKRVQLYPNPTTGHLTIEGEKAELAEVSIWNALGQEVTSQVDILERGDTRIVIDLADLAVGVYYLKTQTRSQQVHKE